MGCTAAGLGQSCHSGPGLALAPGASLLHPEAGQRTGLRLGPSKRTRAQSWPDLDLSPGPAPARWGSQGW